MTRSLRLVVAVATSSAVLLAGCGGDDDEGSVETYCRFSNLLAEQEEVPTDEQLDRLAEAAPAEIHDDVEVVVDALKEVPQGDLEAALSDEELAEVLENIEEFEVERCGDAEETDTGE